MRDVSKRVFRALLEGLAFAGATSQPVRELEIALAELGDWATWDEWVDFLVRVEALAEGNLRSLGERIAEVPTFSYLKRVNALFTNPPFMYSIAGRWVGNSLFPRVRCDTVEVGDGRLEQTLMLPKSYRDSPGFFHLMHGALVATPLHLGLPKAYVGMALHPRRAVYSIVPPPPMSLASRWRRSLRTVLSGADHEALQLFSHLIETLQEGNAELDRQRSLVQARAEALEAALRDRDQLLAEKERMADQLAKARDELQYHIQEAESDSLVARLRTLSSRAFDRELLERIADFVEAIDSGSEP